MMIFVNGFPPAARSMPRWASLSFYFLQEKFTSSMALLDALTQSSLVILVLTALGFRLI